MSRSLYIPEGYKSALTLRETQHAIKYIKDVFQQALSFALTLDRVSAPLIVKQGSGINDDTTVLSARSTLTSRRSTAAQKLFSRLQSGREWRFTVTAMSRARESTPT